VDAKFWERLSIGLFSIIVIALIVGIFKDQVNYTQVIVAVVGLIGVVRGVGEFKRSGNGNGTKEEKS